MKSNAPAVWSAFRGGREVLRFREGPGPLVSTALPPPGTPPVQHAFLTATALDPATEGELREILEASRSFADFSERLKKAGYDVRRTDSPL